MKMSEGREDGVELGYFLRNIYTVPPIPLIPCYAVGILISATLRAILQIYEI